MILPAQTLAQQAPPTPAQLNNSARYTQLKIVRRALNSWSSLSSPQKEAIISGGALVEVIRMHRNSLAARTEAYKLLQPVEYLVLRSQNNTRCYISLTVIHDLGFASIEDFRQHLVEADVTLVECVADLDATLNIAQSILLHYDMIRSNDERRGISKPAQGGRVSP